jgi:quercetin dioxygenase-like cupin family protein
VDRRLAFGAGEGLSEHTAPFDAFVYVVEGEATIHLDGTPHTLAAGDMLILPADVPHAVHAATDLKMLLVMLRA